ncbi:MAG: signal peptidase I [Clostridiales bacterium]|nr:signal peptidase I [Clostridiales bacterium]MDD6389168.1 signal peptidase I [Bacillota bacterium]
MNEDKNVQIPELSELEAELERVRYNARYGRTLRSTVYSLIIVAAVAVLVATLWMPVLRTYGESMTPTLHEGDILVTVKTDDFKEGDIVAFYYNNKILVKRVIASSGEWVDIDDEGIVYVNNEPLYEPYINEPSIGDCNIQLPYQVPDGRVFVMGDHRATSIDSRNESVGCVAQEQIVGKIVFRVWPLSKIGNIN